MKINNRSIRKSAIAAVATVLLGIASSCTDLWSEQHPGTFYISDGKTVATFLEEYQDADGENCFSDFITILKKVNLWEDLKTYGDRTCFVPYNSAIRAYLKDRYEAEPDEAKKAQFVSVESLPLSILDTIARTHLIRKTIFIKDLNSGSDGTLPSANMLDRYLTYSTGEDTIDGQIKVAYYINQLAKIDEKERDDSLVNGVVHAIKSVITQSNLYIPGYLQQNNLKKTTKPEHTANIFYEALSRSALGDELGNKFLDFDYHEHHQPGYDSTFACLEYTKKVAVEYSTGNEDERVVWPEERYFKYTFFVVSDSTLWHYNDGYCSLAGLNNGIRSYDDLVKYAEAVYPEGKGKDASNIQSSISKLISYHVLPCFLQRGLMNFTNDRIIAGYKAAGFENMVDMEDFYETMHPYAIMRISTPYDAKSPNPGKNIYINRKGTVSAGNLTHEGIRIWHPDETNELNTVGALNGGYYFVDSILLFDRHTKNALNTRMRFMGNTLSPDFINSNARGRMNVNKQEVDYAVYSFKDGFCKNFKVNNEQSLMVVRYQMDVWDVYYYDEMFLGVTMT